MKILLIGSNGQLGQIISPHLNRLGDLVNSVRALHQPCEHTVALDLANDVALLQTLDQQQPKLIVNCAAYTAVDSAEEEPELAHAVNARAPRIMAQWAERHQAALLHFSTDYVFDGCSGRPYRETDPVNPGSVYGASKLAGEQAVTAHCRRHLILRTAWVYSSAPGNFFSTILQRLIEGEPLKVVRDQVGRPTYAVSLARVATRLARRLLDPHDFPFGLYHYADSRVMSWYEFAQQIAQQAMTRGLLAESPVIRAAATRNLDQKARRPAYSVLDCGHISRTFGIQMGNFEQSLTDCMDQYVSLNQLN